MRDFFWERFDAAELYGKETVKGVAEASFDEYKDDVEGLTALVMVINHKSWAWHDLHRDELCSLYADLYYKYYEKAINYLDETNPDGLSYFIRTLD